MGKKKDEHAPVIPVQPTVEAKPAPAEVKTPAPVIEQKPVPVAEVKIPAPVIEQKPVAEIKPAAKVEKSNNDALANIEIKATLDQASPVKTIMEIISFLVDELQFTFTDAGLHYRAIDSSHVGAIFIDFYTTMFVEYKATGPISFTLNALDIIKVMRRAKISDTVSFSFSGRTKDIFAITMVSDKSRRTFKLKIKDMVSTIPHQEVDDFVNLFKTKLNEKMQVSFDVETTMIDDIVKDAKITSDLLMITSKIADRSINFSTNDENGEYDVMLPETSLKNLVIKGDASGIYSINFLQAILKMGSLCDDMKISFFNAAPLFFEFKIQRNEKLVGIVYYILAPRVEANNEDEDLFDDENSDDEVEEEVEEEIEKTK